MEMIKVNTSVKFKHAPTLNLTITYDHGLFEEIRLHGQTNNIIQSKHNKFHDWKYSTLAPRIFPQEVVQVSIGNLIL